MEREMLMQQVKETYARLAFQENRDHVVQAAVSGAAPDQYYEELLNVVLEQISEGRFDAFQSGDEIVDAVAKDKGKWLQGWLPSGSMAQ